VADGLPARLPVRTHQVLVEDDAKGPAADAVRMVLGIPLPVVPNAMVRGGGLAALWLGPDEWLVVGPPGTAGGLQARLRAAVGGTHAAVTDVSAQRGTLLVAGPRSRDLLAHGVSLDLYPRSFGAGRCAQTLLARAQVVLAARDERRPGFWALVRSSYAAYLAEWLLDAAVEYAGPPS
jgi:sarcosine oxidase subunit gamma